MKEVVQGYKVEIAKEFGVVVAIVFNQVNFWHGKGDLADGWVYKEYKEICDDTGLSEKQVRLAYSKLEEIGFIETKTALVKGKHTKCFRLSESKISETYETSVPETEETSVSNIYSNNNSISVASDDTLITKKNVTKSLLDQILVIINPAERPTLARLRLLNGRLSEYSADEIVAAAKAFSKSTWHKENKQMSVDNLLAPSKFGRWYVEIALVTNKPKSELEIYEEMKRDQEAQLEYNKNGWGSNAN